MGTEGRAAAHGGRAEGCPEAERRSGAAGDARRVRNRREENEELCSTGGPDRAHYEADGPDPTGPLSARAQVPRGAHVRREELRRAEGARRTGVRALLVGRLTRG